MAIDPAALKSEVETVVADVEDVLNIADALPLPAQVKTVLATVQTVLADVKAFLDA